jgi:cytochrome d ubiquinol oxidase subunit II
MALSDLVGICFLGSLVIYCLTAGADFGGGLWHLLAVGPRAERQRATVEDALAPIWEANHVWVILALVLLYTCFPHACAVSLTLLHVPLTLMLLGIVCRGAAFVFRQYGLSGPRERQWWGSLFAASSVITPLLLGMCIGAVMSGEMPNEPPYEIEDFYDPWLAPAQLCAGVFTLALFAFLAAVYLAAETDDSKLRDDFRLRAILAGAVLGVTALVGGFSLGDAAAPFRERFFHSNWTWPLQIATGVCAVGVFAALATRRFSTARLLAILQVALIVVGWGAAQYPNLVSPSITLANSAAPPATLSAVLVALAAGAVLLFPSLYYLYRTFKGRSGASVPPMRTERDVAASDRGA